MTNGSSPIKLDREILREEIRKEYCEVATNPNRGFHFHTGRTLARITEYPDEWLDNVPDEAVEAFAGTGNPFRIRTLEAGEKVVDIGSGAGIDSFIASNQVGEGGAVIGVDMTPEMLDKANRLKSEAGFDQVAVRDPGIEIGIENVLVFDTVRLHIQQEDGARCCIPEIRYIQDARRFPCADVRLIYVCLLYTSDAADELRSG